MALFGRKKAKPITDEADKVDTTTDDANADTSEASEATTTLTKSDEPADEALDDDARRRASRLRPREDVDLSKGPYDAASAPKGEYLDFGALRVTPPSHGELRLDVDETGEIITGLTALFGEAGDAAVQLQAFAAPKTSGVWYGIRREIAEAIISSGGESDEVDGPYGTELHVCMPAQGPDGRTTFSPARFVGIDGPRWFLRIVLSGQAAVDDDAAAQAMDFVRGIVVNRGREARAPRELLELTIPSELLEQPEHEEPAHEEPDATISRLERGPEITETR